MARRKTIKTLSQLRTRIFGLRALTVLVLVAVLYSKKQEKGRPVSTGEAIMGTMVMKTVAMIYTMGKMRCTYSMYHSIILFFKNKLFS